jgi:phosphatidylglycerophosphate synthase
MSKNRQFSWLPNAISVSRILSVPVLVILAIRGAESAYATLLLLALLSDVADGWLARRWGLASPAGALLDSAADILLITAILHGIWQLHPEVYREDGWVIYSVVAAWAVAHCASLVKFGRLASFHTRLIRFGIFAFSTFSMVLFVFDYYPWVFYFAGAICTLAAIEHLAMLALLPKWTPDIRGGLLEVLQQRKSERTTRQS